MSRNLFAAAAAGDADSVREALTAGADINSRGEYGDSALNVAAEHGRSTVVALLIEAGADIENLGAADKTPVMNAAFAGHAGIVQMLVARGARINDDLLNSVAMKVNILEENAEDGMVRPEAVQAWRDFLSWLTEQRRKQDAAEAG